ncbi:Glutathione S-transferase [Durusdinium trenchii]|uniref:Glutathione S-transferase n=1 Tax=Durusdinium trenchii TaxID=1381693 RepID=A0ABP0JE65_9DINO
MVFCVCALLGVLSICAWLRDFIIVFVKGGIAHLMDIERVAIQNTENEVRMILERKDQATQATCLEDNSLQKKMDEEVAEMQAEYVKQDMYIEQLEERIRELEQHAAENFQMYELESKHDPHYKRHETGTSQKARLNNLDADSLYMNFQQYMGKYNRQDWMKFQQQQGQQQSVPYSASDCKSLDELDAWHKRQLDTVSSFIPEAFQSSVLDNIKEEYEKNKERLGGAVDVDDTNTKAAIPAAAPAASSGAALKPTGDDADPEVEKALAKARAALAQSSSVESPKALMETEFGKAKAKAMLQPPLATELAATNQESGSTHPWRAAGVVLLGLAMPAALAMLGLGTGAVHCPAGT